MLFGDDSLTTLQTTVLHSQNWEEVFCSQQEAITLCVPFIFPEAAKTSTQWFCMPCTFTTSLLREYFNIFHELRRVFCKTLAVKCMCNRSDTVQINSIKPALATVCVLLSGEFGAIISTIWSLHQQERRTAASVHTNIFCTWNCSQKRSWRRMPHHVWRHHVRSELNIPYGGGWGATLQITSSPAVCVAKPSWFGSGLNKLQQFKYS